MVTFNELRITKDGLKLIVDFSVGSESFYQNIYLKRLYIQTQDEYTDVRPSVPVDDTAEKGYVYFKDLGEPANNNAVVSDNSIYTKKNFRIELSGDEFMSPNNVETKIDLTDNMFIVWVECVGTIGPTAPCGSDHLFTVGVVFDKCNIYKEFMNNIKDIEKCCELPKNFIDCFLRLKAIEISIEANHIMQAVKYYTKFVKKKIQIESANICNCHG